MQEMKVRDNRFFTIGMIVSMFCWGLSWTSGKILASYGNATNISFYRFLITTVSLLLLLVIMKERVILNKKSLLVIFIASICLSVYTYFFLKGLSLGTAGAGGVLVTTLNPLVTFGLTLLLTFKKPTQQEQIGLLVGAIATLILLKVWDNSDLLLSGGNLFFLMATLMWSVLSRFTSMAKDFGSPFIFSFWMYFLCTVMMFTVSDVHETVRILMFSDMKFWFNMFFSATITTAVATTFYFYATTKIGVNKASSYIFLVPTTAALGAWMFLGEVPAWYTVIGGIFGIFAVYQITSKR
jgi:drug/metabolite transporter (DMT)-like permease